jgi:lipopolysaccharide export system ATP-binding protein
LSIIIHSKDLIKTYHNRTVVNHVSVKLEQGEIVGLLGPNGAGKTTTFYMVVGLIKPDSGDVFLNDINITRQPMYKRAQMGIGYLPQEASVFRKLSVEDNLKAVLEMTKLTRGEQKHKLEALLDEFHLHHVRKNNGDSLSGGERRRTEIARALAVDPKFILLDEPFAGVDPIAVEDIQSVVARLKFRNIGILITDHNVNETLSICDRAYLLIDGKIFKHGTAEELAEDEQVRRLYLGRNFELKRKDYLHEEARQGMQEPGGSAGGGMSSDSGVSRGIAGGGDGGVSGLDSGDRGGPIEPEKLAQSIDYLINDTEKIIRSALESAFNVSREDDVDPASYTRFFKEVKEAATSYGEENNMPKVIEAASQLKVLDIESYLGNRGRGGAIGMVISAALTYRKGKKFEQDLMENVSILKKLLLYVQNTAYQEIM